MPRAQTLPTMFAQLEREQAHIRKVGLLYICLVSFIGVASVVLGCYLSYSN